MADLYQAKQMRKLFTGAMYAYGEFVEKGRDGKKVIGECITQRQPVTDELWYRHLNGNPPSIGIIPISESSECRWGVIDIDDYELDQAEILERLTTTPLVPCRSKSGGLWLFLFSSTAVPAKVMRKYLLDLSSFLGFGGSEVFPKQERVDAAKGAVGNWLNMPYFGHTRCGISLDTTLPEPLNVREMTLEQFIQNAQHKQVKADFFSGPQDKFNYDASPIESGPPCLQVLSIKGFPEHTRNISLFNIAIYAKRATPNEWQVIVRQFNKKLFTKPLSDKEVDEIIKSLDKKEYSYQCNSEPLLSCCNAPLCRTRKYGISSMSSLPIVNSITKIVGDEALWIMDVEGGRLELTTEELHDANKFSVKCLNTLNIVLPKIKTEQWKAWLQQQLLKVIEVRDEVLSGYEELNNAFNLFVINRLSPNRDEITINRVWYYEEHHLIRFKLEALMSFIRFRRLDIGKNKVIWYLKNRGAEYSVGKTEQGKSYRFISMHIDKDLEDEILVKQDKRSVI